MHLFAKPLWMPKAGNTKAEYEDAFWPRHSVEGISERRFAVADGATETSFSGVWAKQLVRAYGQGLMDSEPQFLQCLSKLQQQWSKIVHRKPLRWYAEEKLRSGTFSAFLGLRLFDGAANNRHGTWVAIASGDSCLIQIRNNVPVVTFPMSDSSSFGNRPVLLSSKPALNAAAIMSMAKTDGEWDSGDTFYLMTDALASWFFREHESGQRPWAILRDLELDTSKPFRAWVEDTRRSGGMKNDDVTLYHIDID